jgi:non-ribosomal peptide synthetase component F
MSPGADIQVMEWLKALQGQQAEMRQFEYCSLVDVQGWSDVPRGQPLFESLFVFENFPVTNRHDKDKLHVVDSRSVGQTSLPLTLFSGVIGSKLGFRALYSRNIYEQASIIRLLRYMRRILEGLSESWNSQLGDIELLDEAERQTLLVDWNQTEKDFGAGKNIQELFEEQAANRPETIALVYAGEKLSYAALNRRVNQLTHYLRSCGVGPEVKVGICLERSIAMVIAILAVTKSGGAYVPLEPSYPSERLGYMVRDSELKIVLTQEAMRGKITDEVQVICIEADREKIAQHSEANPELIAGSEHLAYVIYTSGSTGKPKGVGVSHRSLNNFLTALDRDLPIEASDPAKTPFGTMQRYGGSMPLLALAPVIYQSWRPRDAEYLIELRDEASRF